MSEPATTFDLHIPDLGPLREALGIGDLEKRVGALEQAGRPAPAPRPTPPTVPPDYTNRNVWRLTFQDDFDHADSTPDPSLWEFDFADGHRNLPDNGERQLYFDPMWAGADGKLAKPINPFSIADSVLTITADKMPDWVTPENAWGYWYSSGMIRAAFSQTYGRFVARMKMPAGKGLWPAFWLLPTDHSWPPELDPVEFFGGPNANGEGGPTMLHVGLVTADKAAGFGKWIDAGMDLTADFHLHALEWSADELVYSLDGKEIARTLTPDDADKPMYPIVNLAVGGGWPGDPPPETVLPARLAIDFVRIFAARTP